MGSFRREERGIPEAQAETGQACEAGMTAYNVGQGGGTRVAKKVSSMAAQETAESGTQSKKRKRYHGGKKKASKLPVAKVATRAPQASNLPASHAGHQNIKWHRRGKGQTIRIGAVALMDRENYYHDQELAVHCQLMDFLRVQDQLTVPGQALADPETEEHRARSLRLVMMMMANAARDALIKYLRESSQIQVRATTTQQTWPSL